jgi:hypothetical protein
MKYMFLKGWLLQTGFKNTDFFVYCYKLDWLNRQYFLLSDIDILNDYLSTESVLVKQYFFISAY